MLHPPPPPVPTLAFSEESATLFNGEVSEGFITPKKEKEAHFFRRRSQSTIGEECKLNAACSPTPAVKILVGSRDRIEQWLKESGPGSSCLWAQAEDFSPNSYGKVLSRQLKLTYRLHSEQNPLFLPVLNGTVLELSPLGVAPKNGGALRKSLKRRVTGEVKRSSLLGEPQSPTMQSPSNASSNSAGCDMSPSLDRRAGLAGRENSVGLVIPEKAYRQLVVMVSPEGVIREYQELLRRSVASFNFLDVEFQLLDMQKWLKCHPFAAFLEGSDVVVVRRGDGPSGLRWALLRFDFGEGLVRSTKGEDPSDLELIFGKKGSNQVLGTRVGWWGQNVASSGDKAQEKHLEKSAPKLDWKIWTVPVPNGNSSVGPLTRLLFDALGSEGALSVAEINSLKSLFSSQEVGEPTEVPCFSAGEVKDIPTVLVIRSGKVMSSMEKCALSHLRSDSEELKGRGLCVLLNMLLEFESNTALPTGPIMQRTPEVPCLVSPYSNYHTNYCGALTAESVVRPREAGTSEGGRHGVSSHSERTLKVGERNWCGFEESKRHSGGDILQKDDSKVQHGVDRICIMDWLKNGFLEALLERLLSGSEGGQNSGEGLEKRVFLNVDVALEACLRVLEMVPEGGSSQLSKLLILSLKEAYQNLMKVNLNLKQHWDCELDMQMRCQDRGEDVETPTSGNIFHARTKARSKKLQDIFEKLLRICKLLSLLTSRSPLIGGPFAKSGGLDLVLDLYICLVKRFPTNLRLGALSSAVGQSKSLEQTLPGEAVKSQDTPLKVLPCILPSACICRVAQACLMDHCMTPKNEKVEFAWPPTTEWKALCPFKYRLIDSNVNKSERSRYEEFCDNPLEADFNSFPETPEEVALMSKPCKSTPTLFSPDLYYCSSNSSGITPPSGNGYSSPCTVNITVRADSQVEGTTAPSHILKQTRPFVPRLPLNTLRSSTSRFGPSAPTVEWREAAGLQYSAADPNSSQVRHIPGVSTLEFEIFTAVYDVKLELLKAMGSLFSNCSRSLHISRIKLLQKFQQEEEDQLVMQFLPDIIGGFLNIVPENTSRRIKRKIFQAISLLDKCRITDGMSRIQSSGDCKTEEALGLTSRSISPGPPFSRVPKRLADSLLLEIGERLRILVSHLSQMLAVSQTLKDKAASNNSKESVTYRDPLLGNHTISSGHLLSLWVDVGLLLRVLGDFILLWPGGGSVQYILNSCGRQLESVLGLLADYSSKSTWSLAQIVTMENLLKLLTVCIKGSVLEKRPESHMWSQIDTFFWQLLVVNDLHWNCVKSFTTWVVMKSCQGCLKNMFDGYQKVLWEPLEIYYSMLGERINKKSGVENLTCTLHGVDMSKRSIFPFLRVSILMIKKRLRSQGQSSAQPCPTLYMDRLPFLLDFLMNPLDGLLMNAIRSPVPCIKLSKTQRETEAVNLLHFTNSTKSVSEKCVPNGPGPTLPASNDTLYLNHMQEQCKKCASTPCAMNCDQKFTSCIKQESLGILAEIFALKFFDHSDEQQGNLCVNPRMQNPFLFWKYVNPYLEIIFFSFVKVYNNKAEDGEPCVISPFSQCISGHSKTSAKDGQQLTEHPVADDSSLGQATTLARNYQDDVFCSGCSQDKEVTSVVCVTYSQVLRALAQNQTDDVSQSFRQMRVMKFLVQQIGLEYEVSQVATPRDIQKQPAGVSTPFAVQELQGFDCRDFEARITKAGLSWNVGRSNASIVLDKEDNKDRLKTSVEENIRIGLTMKKAATFGGVRNCKRITKTVTSALLLSKGCPESVRDVQDSSYSSLDPIRLTAQDLISGSSLQNSCYRLGFHSARHVPSAGYRRFQLEDYLPKQPLCNSQDLQLTDRKIAIETKAVPSGWQDGNDMFKKHSMGVHGPPSTEALSQRKGGALNTSNKTSEESKENDLRPSISGFRYHNVLDGAAGSNHVSDISNPSAVWQVGDIQGPPQALLHDLGGVRAVKALKDVRYTGRFFDLNEEVERELAQEDYPEAKKFSQETNQTARNNKHLDVIDDMQEEKDLQKSDWKGAPLDHMKLSKSTSDQSSDSELSFELGPGFSPKQKLSRPAIPRLNLSKSVRKGGPAINSDTYMALEFLPSTASSTMESKPRLNAMLEFQRELQKETVSTDRDSDSMGIGASYETGRLQRRLYRHTGLHLIILELFVSLMLTPQGTLETWYSDRYPMENRKLNAPFFLSYHLNHAANVYLLPCLSKRLKEFKPAAFRILKLTWRALFNPSLYTSRVRIARGAVSQVYTAKVKKICSESERAPEGLVVLKIVDVPKGPSDPCKFFDVYSEVEILEKFLGEPAVCQIVDYGVDTESFVLVLKHYKCSLHTWRQGHCGEKTFSLIETQRIGAVEKFVLERLPLYLEVFSAVLQAVKLLETENVVHYDLKCDNILLEPVDPSCSESEFWTPTWPPAETSKPLPFRICIADFGQSKASAYVGGECTMRNRGTEYVKSPEMLKMLSSQSQRDSDFNLRTTDESVGKAVDVWSLGCLLYELLTGEYLFYDEDWLQFFMRVTLPSEELISKEKAAQLDYYGPVLDLLKFILVRDPLQRPSVDDVAICVEQLQLKLDAQAVAHTSNANDEVPTRIQILSEEDSDTDESNLDEQIISSEIEIVPDRVEQKRHQVNSLECLKRLVCHCQCGD